jgi:hypothetical protein
LLVGAMEESRSVTVLAFRHFTESKDLPLVRTHRFFDSIPSLLKRCSNVFLQSKAHFNYNV